MGRILTVMLIVAGLGGLGLVGWVSLQGNEASASTAQEAAPSAAQRTVLVANAPLRAGALIKPEDLTGQVMPTDQVDPAASDNTPLARSQLYGAMVRHSLAAGDVILPRDVMRPGDHGFLAAVLQPGMRAMTLGAGTLASDIDLIWPGDHVDLILTQMADGSQGNNAARKVFGNVVLMDIRVLAVDQQLIEGASADQPAPKGPRTITVELTPEQAARLAVAMQLGRLSFSVHAADRSAVSTTPVTPAAPTTVWAGDVAPGLGRNTAPTTHSTIHVWQGSADGKEFQF